MKKILVLGAGAMGSAFTVPCIDNNNEVVLVGTHLENDSIDQIKNQKNFHKTLNCKLSDKLKIAKFDEFSKIFSIIPDLIVVAVNSKGIEWVGKELSKYYKTDISNIISDDKREWNLKYAK